MQCGKALSRNLGVQRESAAENADQDCCRPTNFPATVAPEAEYLHEFVMPAFARMPGLAHTSLVAWRSIRVCQGSTDLFVSSKLTARLVAEQPA